MRRLHDQLVVCCCIFFYFYFFKYVGVQNKIRGGNYRKSQPVRLVSALGLLLSADGAPAIFELGGNLGKFGMQE